jgi:hypothetical protein
MLFYPYGETLQYTLRTAFATYENGESSHPREPPPQVPTEPDLNVSAHPAPIVQPLHTALSNEQTDSAVSAQCDSATVPPVFYDAVGVCIECIVQKEISQQRTGYATLWRTFLRLFKGSSGILIGDRSMYKRTHFSSVCARTARIISS